MKNKINKKGFTLLELLAVIVILAVLAIITIPMITGLIDEAKINSYKDSVMMALRSSDLYTEVNGLDLKDGVLAKDLNLKNNDFTDGSVILADNELQAVNITNGDYCANGPLDNLTVYKGACDNEIPQDPTVTVPDYAAEVTYTVTERVAVTSGVKRYEYLITNSEEVLDRNLEPTDSNETGEFTINTESKYVAFRIVSNADKLGYWKKVDNKVDNSKPIVTSSVAGKTATLNLIDLKSGVKQYCINTEDNSTTCSWIDIDPISNNETVTYEAPIPDIYYLFSKDAVGNISDSKNIEIDSENPVINISPPSVTIKSDETYDLMNGVTCTDNVSCDVTYTTNYVEKTVGNYTVNYTATDLAGNTSQAIRTIEVLTASTPWVAYNEASGTINSPATSVSVSMSGAWGFSRNSFGSTGGHTNSTGGSMYVGTRNIDGSSWLPTKGCKYLNFTIRCGSSSGWWVSSSGVLRGKKADGSEVTIMTGSPTNNNNTAWTKSNVDVSQYEYIRLYGTASYNTDVNAWLNEEIANLEFHN